MVSVFVVVRVFCVFCCGEFIFVCSCYGECVRCVLIMVSVFGCSCYGECIWCVLVVVSVFCVLLLW